MISHRDGKEIVVCDGCFKAIIAKNPRSVFDPYIGAWVHWHDGHDKLIKDTPRAVPIPD